LDARTHDMLEYDKIRVQLAEETLSGLGRELALELSPLRSTAAVRAAIAETTEARTILAAGAQIPLWGLADVRPLLARAEKAGVLNAGELVRIADCLRGCGEFRRYMASKQRHAPNLSCYAEGLVPLDDLTAEVYHSTDGARVADRASPRLARIRKDMRIADERIKSRLQSFLTSPQYREALQDNYVTMRGERYTLPIKASHRARISGTVVDSSHSGMTVYIEPSVIGKLTEELHVLRSQEEAEEYQVLTALTGLISDESPAIKRNLEIMAVYDLAFAKGRLSLAMRAEPAEVSEDGFIQLLGARHPLLTGEVVPVDLVIGERYRTLIITGPNTGGKTVVLKTAGLLTLMAQAGLHIPAKEGSIVSVFAQVLADIGDSQSIEQSLSTFSGHMSRIAGILGAADANSLVLLDEIGTGTDPAEGAALAMAVLEQLHVSGCVTIASTHYSDVKRLADERGGFINGRMDFDAETLRPLYSLVTGEAGESQALWIASRLGISEAVLRRARQYLGERGVADSGGPTREGAATKPAERLRTPRRNEETLGAESPKQAPGAEGPGPSHSRRPWRLGDSVSIETTGEQGVVAVLPDERGEMTVFCRRQRVRVHERRVKLIVGAEHLYPDGYDLRTVLFTWQERQTIHDMRRMRDEVVNASDTTGWIHTGRIEVDRRPSDDDSDPPEV